MATDKCVTVTIGGGLGAALRECPRVGDVLLMLLAEAVEKDGVPTVRLQKKCFCDKYGVSRYWVDKALASMQRHGIAGFRRVDHGCDVCLGRMFRVAGHERASHGRSQCDVVTSAVSQCDVVASAMPNNNIINNNINNNNIYGGDGASGGLSGRQEAFRGQVMAHAGSYDRTMLEKFWLYWSEASRGGQMKWEMQKTWDLSRRLARWRLNELQYARQASRPAAGMAVTPMKPRKTGV